MIKLLVSVMALETERLRLSFSRLSLFPGRVQQPKRQVGRQPVGLCVCRLGLPAHRQVHPQSKESTLLLEVVLQSVGLCVCRLGLPARRQVHPQNKESTLLLEVVLRPVGLCVYRLGLPARRQVEPGFDSGLTAQIRLSFCHLEAASRAELFRLLHQPPELLRVAHPVFLCALFRALPGVAKPERLLAQSLASPCRLAEVPDPVCPFAYLAQMVPL